MRRGGRPVAVHKAAGERNSRRTPMARRLARSAARQECQAGHRAQGATASRAGEPRASQKERPSRGRSMFIGRRGRVRPLRVWRRPGSRPSGRGAVPRGAARSAASRSVRLGEIDVAWSHALVCLPISSGPRTPARRGPAAETCGAEVVPLVSNCTMRTSPGRRMRQLRRAGARPCTPPVPFPGFVLARSGLQTPTNCFTMFCEEKGRKESTLAPPAAGGVNLPECQDLPSRQHLTR